MKKCLICYKKINETDNLSEYHKKCSKKLFGRFPAPALEYSFDDINSLAEQHVKNRLSITGVQPKLSLALEKVLNSDNPKNSRLTIVGLFNGLFIFKPLTTTFPGSPETEALTMNLAEKCGIKTAKSGLIRFKSGELAYISKRFDREIKRDKVIKFHQEDFCQVTGLLTENKYNSSMEKAVNAIKQYSTFTGLDLIEFYQTAVYSFLVGNADMHLKNFSFQFKEDESIGLSPAYDLLSTKILMSDDKEEMALSINGKKKNLKLNDFNILAKHCEISEKAQLNVHENFKEKISVIKETVEESFLNDELKNSFLALIGERFERLGLL